METAVRLHHLPTGVVAEADERRSQAVNSSEALRRLRIKLALKVPASQFRRAPSGLAATSISGKAPN